MTRTTDSTEQVLRELDAQVVFCGYTRGELSEAFDLVKDHNNWKYPVRACVGFSRLQITNAAVEFFAGCRIHAEKLGPAAVDASDGRWEQGENVYLVTAAGYYVAVGA